MTRRLPVTERMAVFASTLSFDDLPRAVVEHLKVLLLDANGIMIRAGAELPSTFRLLDGLRALAFDRGEIRALSAAGTHAPAAAAFIDAMTAHSLDFDDTHAQASTHPGAAVIAAALACAQVAKADGRRVLTAMVAGYEVHLRLSLALVPDEHYKRGHALTSTCGTFAAATAAGAVLGLSSRQMAHAFGLCLNQASGSLQFLEGGTWAKRFQVGYAAFNGVIAAMLARAGYEGAEAAIEGRYGFLNNYSGRPDFPRALAGLGESYLTLGTGVKPYPACRYAHAAMDAVIALRARHGIAPGEVRGVRIGLNSVGFRLLGEPVGEKRRPRTVVDGQFSMPFCAAVALSWGRLIWDDLAAGLADDTVMALCELVEVGVDPRVESLAPRRMSGAASIETPRGTFDALVEVPLGEPGNFPTRADRMLKFEGLVAPYLSADRVSALVAAIERFEEIADVTALHDCASIAGGIAGGDGDFA